MKKYEFIGKTFTKGDVKLRKILAVKSFNDVKAGDLGGWIEEEDNLSHFGDCWVYDEAKVFGKAKVYDNAKIKNNALVFSGAHIFRNAEVIENARVYGRSRVFDNAKLCECARVSGWSGIFGNAIIRDDLPVGSIRRCNYEEI